MVFLFSLFDLLKTYPEKINNMINLHAYPYPSYVPNKIAAGCVAAVVSISLIAWFIQSCQTRFRPLRLCILLLISHLAICTELLVHATVNTNQENERIIFTVLTSLFATGQRMIIVSNFSFVLEIHHEKSRLARGIFLGAVLCVVTSGLLIAPANIFASNPDQIDTSFIFRQLSASVLLAVTLIFYPILYWSKTIKDMTMQAAILIIVSSVLCLTVAIFNLIQSISIYYYTEINSGEGWFYGFQMTPIILAHFTWSIFHPKRSLSSKSASTLELRENILTDEERSVQRL